MSECRLWTGPTNKDGYATSNGYPLYRFVWSAANMKEIPAGMVIHHKCFNKRCVNPDHLESVTLSHNSSMKPTHVHPNPDNPSQFFKDVEDLARRISALGVIGPVTVSFMSRLIGTTPGTMVRHKKGRSSVVRTKTTKALDLLNRIVTRAESGDPDPRVGVLLVEVLSGRVALTRGLWPIVACVVPFLATEHPSNADYCYGRLDTI